VRDWCCAQAGEKLAPQEGWTRGREVQQPLQPLFPITFKWYSL